MTKTYRFLRTALKANEEEYIRKALASCGWNKPRTARYLGISVSSLYRKITVYNIKRRQ